ncbi:MAG TPA: hypothetical protein VMX17_02320 [Candidatus Glassbacteria bacterium]|nr:hypothetical protein [Candidatus Glassbacteria bacterium]
MKIKICVATGERKSDHMFQGEQLVHLVSRLDDRKKTIKLLKSVQGGRYWDDLAWSWVYDLGIVPSDVDVNSKRAEKYLLATTNKKWEKFVRVFCPKQDTTIEIKTIEVGLGDVKNY